MKPRKGRGEVTKWTYTPTFRSNLEITILFPRQQILRKYLGNKI